jgi:hypothetical protein
VAVLVCLVALAAAGCGPHGRTTVKGKVTFNNEPVGMGTVVFVAPDKATGTAQLNEDGTYTMSDAPTGDVRVAVQIPPRPAPYKGLPGNPLGKRPDGEGAEPTVPEAEKMKNMPQMSGKWTYVPDNFADVSKSGLTWTVPAGGGEHDIPLK